MVPDCTGCALLAIPGMLQYGQLFNGPAGVCIPIGLPPPLVVVGCLLWKYPKRPGAEIEDEGDFDDIGDSPHVALPATRVGADSGVDD
jgi:hypothetical protein